MISRVFAALAALALLTSAANIASGQSVVAQQPTPAAAAPAPVATWDSLFAGRQYFALRAAVGSWQGDSTPQVQYFRGLVAHAFNDPDAAILALRPVVTAPRSGLTAVQFRNAVDALGQSLRAVYRYRESADVYESALRTGGSLLDSAARASFRKAAAFGETLSSTLPQRITWTRQTSNDTLPLDSAPYAVSAMINGTAATAIAFTPWTELTILDSTTAATHGVQLLAPVSTPASRASPRTPASTKAAAMAAVKASVEGLRAEDVGAEPVVGVIGSLDLGPAIVSNVVALVVPDSDAALMHGDTVLHAVLGMNVLEPLGRVTFLRDGHIALASPGARPVRDSLLTMIALDGPTPIVAGSDGHAGVPLDIAPPDTARDSTGVRLDFNAMTVTKLAVRPKRQADVLPTITYPSETGAQPAPKEPKSLPEDLAFVSLLFALFVVPKALQRYRIPGAITSLVMGTAASAFGWFHGDPTLHLLSTFGIVALFLFAGLEIDGPELRRNTGALVLHGVLWSVLLALTAAVAIFGFGASPRSGALIALALVTPSTGFILSSVAGFGLLPAEQAAVKTYAVGSELLALAVLFFVLQSTSLQQLALALVAMTGVIVVIPLAFRFFAAVVAPHAPRSEFAFLLMVAVVCAYATRRLGVYYLVGAFLVGVAAQRFRGSHSAMSSEKMVDALESFGSVFIPFYFFRAGTEIVSDQLTLAALGIGIALVVVCIPVRIAVIALHRRLAHDESFATARRVGTALIPTLVFTLVLVEILHTQYGLSDNLAGGLVLYTVLNTTIPALALRGAPPDYENVLGLDDDTSAAAGPAGASAPVR